MMIDLLKDAGFQSRKLMPTDGQPGVFATLDCGRRSAPSACISCMT
jgi:hypothetical protein